MCRVQVGHIICSLPKLNHDLPALKTNYLLNPLEVAPLPQPLRPLPLPSSRAGRPSLGRSLVATPGALSLLLLRGEPHRSRSARYVRRAEGLEGGQPGRRVGRDGRPRSPLLPWIWVGERSVSLL